MKEVRATLNFARNRVDRARRNQSQEDMLRAVEWCIHAVEQMADYIEGKTEEEKVAASGDEDLLDV